MTKNLMKRLALFYVLLSVCAVSIFPLTSAVYAEDVVELEFANTTPIHVYVAHTTYSLQLMYNLKGSTTTKKDVSSEAFWSSTNPQIIKVEKGVLSALSEGEVTISADYKGETKTIKVSASYLYDGFKITNPNNSNIETETLSAVLGDTNTKLNAIAIKNGEGDADDISNDVSDLASWTTSDASIVTVSKGKLTLVGKGKATIKASYKGLSEETVVTVTAAYSALAIKKFTDSSTPPQQLFVGDEVQLKAEATSASNLITPVTDDAVWTSSNDNVATIEKGLLKVKGKGTAEISAAYLGVDSKFTVVARVQYQALILTPDTTIQFSINDQPKQLKAEVMNQLDKPLDVTALSQMEWTSSDQLVATVSATGLLTPKSAGTTRIKASYRGQVKEIEVNVQPTLTAITIVDAPITIYKGESDKLPAVNGTTLNKEMVVLTSLVEWTSSDPNIVIIDTDKRNWSAKKTGIVTLTAKYRELVVTKEIEVKEKVIALNPSSRTITMYAGQQVNLPTVDAIYENGVEEDVSSKLEWKTSSSNVLISNGKIKGLVPSSVSLTTTYLNKTLTITIIVEEEVIQFDINSETVVVYPGKSQSVKVTGTTKSGKKVSLSSKITWAIGNTTLASVKGSQVKGIREGTTKITGSYQGKPLTVPVTVYLRLQKLTSSEKSVKLTAGSAKSLQVTGVFDTGKIVNISSLAVWSSSNAGVVTVNGGDIVAVKKGTATIKTTYLGKSVSIRVTVS